MRKLPAQTGSILVELLVVITIISVVMVGMVTSFGNISRGQVRADKRLEATQYAIEGMEAVYNVSRNDWTSVPVKTAGPPLVNFAHVHNTAASYSDILTPEVNEQTNIGDGTFKRFLVVEDMNDIDSGTFITTDILFRVESKVCWDQCDPDTQTVTFVSYFANII